jgi:hypothetical protein
MILGLILALGSALGANLGFLFKQRGAVLAVLAEPIGSGAVGITARVLAFGLVIFGAALAPAPLRAASGRA